MQNLNLGSLLGRIGNSDFESGVLALLMVLHEPNRRIGGVAELVHDLIAAAVELVSNVWSDIHSLGSPLDPRHRIQACKFAWKLGFVCRDVAEGL